MYKWGDFILIAGRWWPELDPPRKAAESCSTVAKWSRLSGCGIWRLPQYNSVNKIPEAILNNRIWHLILPECPFSLITAVSSTGHFLLCFWSVATLCWVIWWDSGSNISRSASWLTAYEGSCSNVVSPHVTRQHEETFPASSMSPIMVPN